jgi:single-stranded-DNA-specific exonuclease
MRTITEKSMLGRQWVVRAETAHDKNPDFVSQILEYRGISESEEVRRFLNPSIKEQMPDPFVLKDMQAAAEIVRDAVAGGKKIAVFGDYDVDGITSTAILVKYLREAGAAVVWHIPVREGEGYGLNAAAVQDFANNGAELLITVDCGISGVKEVALAKELGMKVVITDHHSPDSELPLADAVVNPKRKDDESGLDYLAGVGVAFMFLVALNREMKISNHKSEIINLMDYLDLVALGTVCDTMPLIGLNRAFVATGLKVMAQRKNLGLAMLMEIAAAKKPSVYVCGFVLGPRLNAAGRLNSAVPALELLLTDNTLIARDLAVKLNEMNKERMALQNSIMLHAEEMAKECVAAGKCSIFLCGDNWHKGVVGIIAGRLKDQFNMPTLVATRAGGFIDGSGRSVASVDLGSIIHDALSQGILQEGGGHAAAAGFLLAESQEGAFCEFLEKKVAEQLAEKTFVREVSADLVIDSGGADIGLVKQLSALEPFGQGNPEPTLILTGAQLAYASAMGNGTHLRGNIRTSAGTQLSFVGFNMTATKVGEFLLDDANINSKIKLLGKLKENEYNGRVSAQFVLEDLAI